MRKQLVFPFLSSHFLSYVLFVEKVEQKEEKSYIFLSVVLVMLGENGISFFFSPFLFPFRLSAISFLPSVVVRNLEETL